MFVREKRIGAYSYLYLVETVRENGKTKQRIVRNLGRKEMVEARGDLDRLARSAARLSQRSMILSLIEDGSAPASNVRRAAVLDQRQDHRTLRQPCRRTGKAIEIAARLDHLLAPEIAYDALFGLAVLTNGLDQI